MLNWCFTAARSNREIIWSGGQPGPRNGNFPLAAPRPNVYPAAVMQIEYRPKNKASVEDVRLGLQFRNIRPTVRNIMQEFSIGQRRATQILHALVQEGILTQNEETKRFRLKPDDAAIEQTSMEITRIP